MDNLYVLSIRLRMPIALACLLMWATPAWVATKQGPNEERAPSKLPDSTKLCIAHGPLYSHCIAFTFDDGPNPDTTPDLLRTLAKYNAHATFFLIGRRVKLYPGLVKSIEAEGSEVANHSFSHTNLTKLSRDDAYREYADCSKAIKAAVGHFPSLCRPPGGDANPLVVDLAGSLGMRTVAWSINIADYELRDPDAIEQRLAVSAQSGDIILLHDKVYETIQCLDDLLHSLQIQGYRFVTVSELMANGTDGENGPFVPKTWLEGK